MPSIWTSLARFLSVRLQPLSRKSIEIREGRLTERSLRYKGTPRPAVISAQINSLVCYLKGRVGDAKEEPFRLAALGTFSQGISDLLDFIKDRYEIGALLTLAGTALKTKDFFRDKDILAERTDMA